MKLWICENSIWLSILISGFEMIITAVLTFIIIYQTKKNNDAVQKLEKQISNRDVDLQRKQLKLELFPYKREIYRHLLSVFSFCEMYEDLDRKISLKDKSAKQLYDIVDTIREQMGIDKNNIRKDLLESKYIFPERIANEIINTANRFEEFSSSFSILRTMDDQLTEEEKEEIIPEMIERTLLTARNNYVEIEKRKHYLINQILTDMDISRTTEHGLL